MSSATEESVTDPEPAKEEGKSAPKRRGRPPGKKITAKKDRDSSNESYRAEGSPVARRKAANDDAEMNEDAPAQTREPR